MDRLSLQTDESDPMMIREVRLGIAGLDALADQLGIAESTQGYLLMSETGRAFNLMELLAVSLAPPQHVRIVLTSYEYGQLLACLAYVLRFRGEHVPDPELTRHLYRKIGEQGNH